MDEDAGKLKRREFLAGLGTVAALGSLLGEGGEPAKAQAPAPQLYACPDPPSAMLLATGGAQPNTPGASDAQSIPSLTNPNILVIISDQFRQPQWLDQAHYTTYASSVIPHIWGLRSKSVSFSQYYVNATACTPSRSCLMTGLYAPQTAMYVTQRDTSEPNLDPLYPTWGDAIQQLNPVYSGNVYWFGKWHLSAALGGTLTGYGFKTELYPSASNPSPNGFPNEGSNGGLFSCAPTTSMWYDKTLASDAQIASDFTSWLGGGYGVLPSHWCATVSLVNPHDIGKFPYWLDQYTGGCQPPTGNGYGTQAYFNPPAAPPAFYATSPLTFPSPWNFESINPTTTHKPPLQALLIRGLDQQDNSGQPLASADYNSLLNYYYSLQTAVDTQVGNILSALTSSGLASKTIVIFTSDHGEYCGSHSMRDKAGAVYDETIRVPLFVAIPGMTQNVNLGQMCSSVDFFGLICDLATGGTAAWRTAYPDLANRESVYDYIYSNSAEQYRIVNIRIGGSSNPMPTPYIVHTTDENLIGESPGAPSFAQVAAPSAVNSHVACIRTKTTSANSGFNGFKYAVYSSWANCSTIPNSNQPDYEYYDYQDSFNNRGELGNNYYTNTDANSLQTLADLQAQFGTWASPTGGIGIMGTELNVQLTGLGTDGATKLNCVLQQQARPAYFAYLLGPGVCTAPSCS